MAIGLGVLVVVIAALGLPFVRWPGDPVRFEVQVEGAQLVRSSVVANYRPDLDMLFVTRS